MTRKTGRLERKIERDGARLLISRRHVPRGFLTVPVHRRFEEKAGVGENISSSAAARADVIKKFARAVERVVAFAIEREPSAAIFFVDLVMNSGLRMGEFAGNQVPFRGSAGAAHRSFLKAAADFRVAAFAGLVTDVFVGGRRGDRRSGAAWGLSKQQRTETAYEAD